MPGKSVDNSLCSLSTALMASNAISDDKKVSKRGRSTGNAVLIFGALLADIALHADRND